MGKQINVVLIAIVFFQITRGCSSVTGVDYNDIDTVQEQGEMLMHTSKLMESEDSKMNTMPDDRHVEKITLKNGMTVLVHPVHAIPKVSVQMWYNVGSKDEQSGEKGIAHLIEHMIFKGTSGKGSLNISESDINTIVHMISGSCNAFTTQDFTGYQFDVPAHHWMEVLPIIADCVLNCSFKEDHLNSEMKAVIQELKMRRDKYINSLYEELWGTIFADHPYHYPIIGYKQDLWTVCGKDLLKFYKKHYHPGNATLVVVGDVDVQEVFALAKKYFGNLKSDEAYKKPIFTYNKDIVSKSVTVYRDITQPMVVMAYVVPGLSEKQKSVIDVAAFLLGAGKSSRLYKKLVNDMRLATSLGSYSWELFDYSLFFIAFEPKNKADTDIIISLIQGEIDAIIKDGVTEQELTRAIKKIQMDYYTTLEDTQQQAFDIGKYYVATGDENYIFNCLKESPESLHAQVRQFLAEYCRPAIVNLGKVLPLPEREKEHWALLQNASDKEDTQFLSTRIRTTPVEEPSYAKKIKLQEAAIFDFPKPSTYTMSNGLKVLYYHNPNTPKINLEVRFKALGYYDPEDKQGLYNFMMSMLSEGTLNYTASELADAFESSGMSFEAYPGGVSMHLLNADLDKGLRLLLEVLTQAVFDEQEIEKVREQLLVELGKFWENPSYFSGQLIRELVYKGHPYSKNILGAKKFIAAMTREDLMDLYRKFITPRGATLAVVGDLSGYNIQDELEKILGSWQGPEVSGVVFPALIKPAAQEINYPIKRDQVMVCFAGLSVDRKHQDYDKLLLFDQILGGGVLGSMKSRLFKLREQSGLFYSISGSLMANANEQPGMVMVKTLVSLDRLAEAEKAIRDTLETVADIVTQEEFTEAKHAILNSLMLNFESNVSIANAFLFLDKYGLAPNYFDTRAETFAKISRADMQAAVKRVLNANELCLFRIGRVDEQPKKVQEAV